MNTPAFDELLATLKARFEKHRPRHRQLEWAAVQRRLETQPDKLRSLQQMELTGGEPDVVGLDAQTGEFLFFDCATESPKDRRSLCYDREALDSRKEFKPVGSAMDVATAMGIMILSESQYRDLQQLGAFDTKTSSWLLAPPEIRQLGGGIFGDRRYGRVFVYHNGPQSYYAGRGFRGVLKV